MPFKWHENTLHDLPKAFCDQSLMNMFWIPVRGIFASLFNILYGKNGWVVEGDGLLNHYIFLIYPRFESYFFHKSFEIISKRFFYYNTILIAGVYSLVGKAIDF